MSKDNQEKHSPIEPETPLQPVKDEGNDCEKLIWAMIEEWQDAREEENEEYLLKQRFSFVDIEHDLYEWLKKFPASPPEPSSKESEKRNAINFKIFCDNWEGDKWDGVTRITNEDLYNEYKKNCTSDPSSKEQEDSDWNALVLEIWGWDKLGNVLKENLKSKYSITRK